MSNPKIEVEVGARITELDDKMSKVESRLQSTGKEFGRLSEFATGALQGVAAAFTVGAITNFAKSVIDTTAEFQKMEAVLTNTLGSNSAARVAMDELSDFASKTPFAVNELTSSFVKLANQGFKPTVNQLRSLGDLAASTGKSFDQLAEAIIDAQVGEFERLKEFGIRASREGDNVAFTFKGVETQVKATDSAIRDYILSLGDAEGVSGAMAGISETVGGKISNLGDNITQLQKEIGDSSSGLIAGVLDLANAFTSHLVGAMNDVNTVARKTGEGGLTSFLKQISALINPAYGNAVKIQADVIKAFDKVALDASETVEDTSKSSEKAAQTFKEFSKEADRLNKILLETDRFSDINFTAQIKLEAIENVSEISGDILKQIEDELKKSGQTLSFDGLTIEVPPNLINPIELPPIDTTQFIESVNAADQAIIDANSRFVESARQMKDQFVGALQGISLDFLVSAISDGMFAVGEALASGGNAAKEFGQVLLSSLSNFLKQLGEQMIAYGTAALAMAVLTQALSNPYTAIPAAIGLIAAGAALALAAGAIQGTLKSGGSSSGGSSGVAKGSSFVGTTSDSFNPNQNIGLSGEFTISGRDLKYVIDQTALAEN